LFSFSLFLFVSSGCSIVHLTADPNGHITGATYIAFIRRYEASYGTTSKEGERIQVELGAKSELVELTSLLESIAKLTGKSMLP